MLSESCGVSDLFVWHTSVSNDSSVDGARYAIAELHVDLGHLELLLIECIVLLDISLRRGIDHVSLLEALDSLILAHYSTAVSASATVGVSLVLLRSSVVSPLGWHFIN